jgi:hypothetical protein
LKVSESVLNLHSLHLQHEVHLRGRSVPQGLRCQEVVGLEDAPFDMQGWGRLLLGHR